VGIHPNIKNKKDARYNKGYPILCPYCKTRSIERHDYKNGNYFCENCGYITKEIRVIYHNGIPYEFTVNVGKIKYKKVNIRRLQRKYEKKTNGGQDWKLIDKYKNYLDYFAGEYTMIPKSRNEALKDIKRANGIRVFCKNCNYERVIAAICVYLMRRDGRTIRIDEHKMIKNTGLTDRWYISIIEKYTQFKIKNNPIH
jgi:hypothetical protein